MAGEKNYFMPGSIKRIYVIIFKGCMAYFIKCRCNTCSFLRRQGKCTHPFRKIIWNCQDVSVSWSGHGRDRTNKIDSYVVPSAMHWNWMELWSTLNHFVNDTLAYITWSNLQKCKTHAMSDETSFLSFIEHTTLLWCAVRFNLLIN